MPDAGNPAEAGFGQSPSEVAHRPHVCVARARGGSWLDPETEPEAAVHEGRTAPRRLPSWELPFREAEDVRRGDSCPCPVERPSISLCVYSKTFGRKFQRKINQIIRVWRSSQSDYFSWQINTLLGCHVDLFLVLLYIKIPERINSFDSQSHS